MKPRLLFTLILLGLLSFSCHKDKDPSDLPFEAQVMGLNPDCGIYQIKITQGLEEVISIVGTSIADGIYIANNLPQELMIDGVIIKLDLRKPENSELGLCTAMGPAYPWIFVTQAEVKIKK
jgi:hypothetical protein